MNQRTIKEIGEVFAAFMDHAEEKSAAAILTGIYFQQRTAAAESTGLLERQEAADRMRISVASVDRHIKSGRLPAVRNGGRVLLKSSVVDDFVESLNSNPLYESDAEINRILQLN